MPLDGNGYARSIMQDDLSVCFLCGRSDDKLDRHECIHSDMGGVLREKSKRYGLWVMLCHQSCHPMVHKDAALGLVLKREAQQKAMERYGWSEREFRESYGRSYL